MDADDGGDGATSEDESGDEDSEDDQEDRTYIPSQKKIDLYGPCCFPDARVAGRRPIVPAMTGEREEVDPLGRAGTGGWGG